MGVQGELFLEWRLGSLTNNAFTAQRLFSIRREEQDVSRCLKAFGLAVMVAFSARAQAADWQLQPAQASRGPVLIYGAGEAVSYRFQCDANEVIVTETGVTKLLDVKTGKPVGDDPQAGMPAGAAM